MSAVPFHHCHRKIVDPTDFDDAVSGMSLRVEFQRRQDNPSTVEQFQAPAWALDFGRTGVATRVSGVLRGGWASFCLSLGSGTASWNGEEAAEGTVGLLPPGAEVGGRTGPGFGWITAAIPPAAWERCLGLAGLESWSGSLTVCRLPKSTLVRLHRLLGGIRQRVRTSTGRDLGQVAAGTADHLVGGFAAVLEAAARKTPLAVSARNRARLSRRAESWMRDRVGEPCRVNDLCLALGVSRRELEYAFRMVFDQGPRERLEALRLHAIRRALRAAGGGRGMVTRIACEHGVAHLGRFAASYRRLFGENPGETGRRAR